MPGSRRGGDGVVLPLGECVIELCDIADEPGLEHDASDEGVHRLGDTLEREHLRDEQVHGVGFDAGAVLQRSGHLVGEACPGLGVAARAVLDWCIGVTHAHDVMQAASVRSSPQRPHASTLSTVMLSRVRVLAQRASLYEGPLPLAPGPVRAVSSFGL